MTLTMPTRELVGLLADVHKFADPDSDNPTWHRVVIRWDGSRIHAEAGDGLRLAAMSWGPDDGDAPLPGMEWGSVGEAWRLAILPADAKEIADKFKLGAKEGEAPLRVTGDYDRLIVERDGENVGVALRSVALARPWNDDAPDIAATIRDVAAAARTAAPRGEIAYNGFALVDFANPKVVRQRGPVQLYFGPSSSYIRIGEHFHGAIAQTTPIRHA